MPIAIDRSTGLPIQVRPSTLPKSHSIAVKEAPTDERDYRRAFSNTFDAPREVLNAAPDRPSATSVLKFDHESLNNWRKILGPDLRFQCGVFGRSGAEVSLEEAGHRYLEHQLGLAGYAPLVGRWPARILDVGCGWGYPLAYLARRFGTYTRVDGIDLNIEQLQHARRMLERERLANRVRLFHGSAEHIDLLPAGRWPYDLISFRGSVKNFTYAELNRTLAAARKVISATGRIIIAENLYSSPEIATDMSIDGSRARSSAGSSTSNEAARLPGRSSATGNPAWLSSRSHSKICATRVADRLPADCGTDRLTGGDRKSPEMLRGFIEAAGFRVEDVRVLPNREDTVRWLTVVRNNIESHFPASRPPAIEDLYASCENLINATSRGVCSMYIIVASPANS
jgi:cyclopropane fatty-acyl-phospholipid synthase-like methyltransferase